MSLGYIGYCHKDLEDTQAIIYFYSGSNWNNPDNDSNYEKTYDGELFINKTVLFHADVNQGINSGEIEIIRPCKNRTNFGSIKIDYLAYRLLHKILKHASNNGTFPESEAFIQ